MCVERKNFAFPKRRGHGSQSDLLLLLPCARDPLSATCVAPGDVKQRSPGRCSLSRTTDPVVHASRRVVQRQDKGIGTSRLPAAEGQSPEPFRVGPYSRPRRSQHQQGKTAALPIHFAQEKLWSQLPSWSRNASFSSVSPSTSAGPLAARPPLSPVLTSPRA
jgi:hypothetical protein